MKYLLFAIAVIFITQTSFAQGLQKSTKQFIGGSTLIVGGVALMATHHLKPIEVEILDNERNVIATTVKANRRMLYAGLGAVIAGLATNGAGIYSIVQERKVGKNAYLYIDYGGISASVRLRF